MRVNLIVVMNQAGSCRITAPHARADTADAWWRQTSGIGISCFARRLYRETLQTLVARNDP